MNTNRYHVIMTLDENGHIKQGKEDALVDAIKRGCDLKIGTHFRHDEHMDLRSPIKDNVYEISTFHQTVTVDDRWCAGFMTLRQPADIPFGFGPRASLSLFLYNQNGWQAVARPYLDGHQPTGAKGACRPTQYTEHKKMKYISCYDEGTNAPSMNFMYAFDTFEFHVRDDWQLCYAHDAHGIPTLGSFEALVKAFSCGADLKVGIVGGLARTLGVSHLSNVVYIPVSYGYHYSDSQLFLAQTQPFVRVDPKIPLTYETDNWDYAWAIIHTDGTVAIMAMDPHTLSFSEISQRYAVHWFTRQS